MSARAVAGARAHAVARMVARMVARAGALASARGTLGAAVVSVVGAVGVVTCARPTAEARPPAARAPAARGLPPRPSATTAGDARRRDEGGRVVRVALGVGVDAPRVGGTGEWRLYTAGDGGVVARVPAGAAWTIERRGTQLRAVGSAGTSAWRAGPLVARPIGLGALLTYGGKRYRGELWVHAAPDGGVTVVDHVPVEEYLRGVVPLELNFFAAPDAPALQAQAVAARSYTYSRLPEHLSRATAAARASRPFDLRATVSDQVYGGVGAERAESDRAIAATAGLVIRYGGAVVSAPYHSACGGSTAEPGEVWGGRAEPYLRRVSDRVPGTDRHYCDAAPRFTWTRAYDGPALTAVLARYLRRVAHGGGGASDVGVGAARALAAEEHTPSGRVGALAVTTDGGRWVLRGNDIRFAVRTVGGEILPSTYFTVDAVAGDDGHLARVTLRGHGNGHGVGMCQWGAIGRARAGQDFRTILRAYYPGAAVEPAE